MTEAIIFNKGDRVSFTDRHGKAFIGAVDVQRRGWVLVDLDEAHKTEQGWEASKMMVKVSDVQVVEE